MRSEDIKISDRLRAAADYYKKEELFWLNQFADLPEKISFPFDFSPLSGSLKWEKEAVRFDEKLVKKLLSLSKGFEQTLHMILTAGTALLLRRYNNDIDEEADIVLGTTIYRQETEAEFVNTVLPLRLSLRERLSFKALLLHTREVVIRAVEHQNYPMETLLYKLGLSSSVEFPLFDAAVLLDNIHEPRYLEHIRENIRFIFSLKGNTIDGVIRYNAGCYRPDTIRRLAGHLVNLLGNSLSGLDLPLADIEITSTEERRLILRELNGPDSGFPGPATIHGLFEKQAARTPERLAITASLNLSELIRSLRATDDRIPGIERLAECCFRKNPYIFDFPPHRIPDGTLDGLAVRAEPRLLITHRKNFVMVNRPVWSLLASLDGSFNMRSLACALPAEGIAFEILPFQPDEETDTLRTRWEHYEFDGTSESLLPLVKALYRNDLVDLTDIRSGQQEVRIDLSSTSSAGPSRWSPAESPAPSIPTADKTGNVLEPVLLLGDSPGEATTGLLYLASFLRRHGIEAYCHWNHLGRRNREMRRQIHNLLDKVKPRLVGISVKWFLHLARALEICRLVKEYDSGIMVVAGGNTASYFWEEFAADAAVDYVVRGDGEQPLLEICRGGAEIPNCVTIQNGLTVNTGIHYVQNEESGKEIFLSHLDRIVLSDDEFLLARSLYIPLGKGCKYQCFYCAGCREIQEQTFNRPSPFTRPVEEVRRDLEAARDYVSAFMFDSEVTIPDFTGFFRGIWEGIDLAQHFCSIYLWKLPPPEFIRLISETFCFVTLNVDLCSFSQRHREKLVSLGLIKPQATDRELLSFLDTCEKYDNVEVVITQIAGLPYFTDEDIRLGDSFLSLLIQRYRCFSGMEWGRLHAQPGAPITRGSDTHGMNSPALTFKDYLETSRLNLSQEVYPPLETAYYPFIYYQEDDLNSRISRYYADTNRSLEENRRKLREDRVPAADQNLSYHRLNRQADRLAHFLLARGIRPGAIVALLLTSPTEIAIAILGVLKAGCAYLPIDTGLPPDRIVTILRESGAGLLLAAPAARTITANCPESGALIDSVTVSEAVRSEISDPRWEVDVSSHRPAYVIYTSGSTGRPKGVLVEHRNAVNALQYRREVYKMAGEKDDGDSAAVVALQLFSYAFDGFVTSFFTPLISGARLVFPAADEITDIDRIRNFITRYKVSHFISVPALYRVLIESLDSSETASLRIVTLAGDQITPDLLERTIERNERLEITNEYGVTEAGVMSTLHREQQMSRQIHIGGPVPNTSIYILDRGGRLSPANVTGELCIGGIGVARGYLNNPELTNERFIVDPFVSPAGSGRLYKSGDRGCLDPEGNILFRGRNDFQVKLRGFRVETGEIENQLRTHPDIAEAVVTAVGGEGEDRSLCAYVVGRSTGGFNNETPESSQLLRDHLSRILPDYMIPAHFVFLDSIPKTTTGKVDRLSLPEPRLSAADRLVPPRDHLEKTLLETWAAVLRLEPEQMGVESNFFELGGHSLKAISLVGKIQEKLDVRIQLADIFNLQTVAALADHIRKFSPDSFRAVVEIPRAPTLPHYPLSSAQKRMFMVQQMESSATHYNMPQFIPLPPGLDRQRLADTFLKLIKRHETLRTAFVVQEGEPVQVIHQDVGFELKFRRMDETAAESFVADFVQPFDLSQVPILRVVLLEIEGRGNLLLLDMHHIICDALSREILVRDFHILYDDESATASPPPLELQYRDYAWWQQGEEQQEVIRSCGEFWLEQFSGEIPVLELATDFPRPEWQDFAGDIVHFDPPLPILGKLKVLEKRNQATMFLVLLGAFNILLSKYSGQEDIVVGTTISGRSHPEVEEIIGVFINMLALRNQPLPRKSFDRFLAEIRLNSLAAFENQDYPYDVLIEKLGLLQVMDRNPLFNTLISHQKIDAQWTGDSRQSKEGPAYSVREFMSKFDLKLNAVELNNHLAFSFEYKTSLFKRESVERMSGHFLEILEQVSEAEDIKLGDIVLSGLIPTGPGDEVEEIDDGVDFNF